MPLQTTAAGDRFNQMVFNDPNDGYPIGGTASGASAGSSSGALFFDGAKSANRTTPDPENTIVTGDDGELAHEYEWSSTQSRRFTIELSLEDLERAGLIQNMPAPLWLSGRYSHVDVSNVYVPNMMAILQRRSKRLADGGGVWSGVVILNATVRYLGDAGFTERGAALFRYSLTPQSSGYNHLGATIFDNNSQQKYSRVVPFQGLTNPLTVVAIKGNGVATQFSLDKPPVDVARTNGIVGRASASIASVATTAPYSATFSSAPTSGLRGLVWHEFTV